MKQSYYNYMYQVGKIGILYNTRTGAVLALNSDELDKIKNPNCFTSDDIVIKKLIENGFIIEDNVDEVDILRKTHLEYLRDEKLLEITILPTEKCNFSCPYCFVYKKENIDMDQTIFNGIYLFIKNYLTNKQPNKIVLSWFGGEPTLRYKDIIVFMDKINALLKNYPHVILETDIITNGYMLDYKMFNKLYKAGIKRMQVTIDGPEEVHDKFRYLKNGEGTFKKIMENLIDISTKTKEKEMDYSLQVRMNFTKESVGKAKELYNIFHNNFADNKRFRLYFRPVYRYETSENGIAALDNEIYSLEEGLREQWELNSMGKGASNGIDLPSPVLSWCTAERNQHFVIGADGTLYLCGPLAGDRKHALGKLMINGELNVVRTKPTVFESPKFKKCLKCKRLPLCFGGCYRKRFFGENNECFWTDSLILDLLKRVALRLQKEGGNF